MVGESSYLIVVTKQGGAGTTDARELRRIMCNSALVHIHEVRPPIETGGKPRIHLKDPEPFSLQYSFFPVSSPLWSRHPFNALNYNTSHVTRMFIPKMFGYVGYVPKAAWMYFGSINMLVYSHL